MTRPALSRPIICLVTDRRRLARGSDASEHELRDRLVRQVREAATAGVSLIQVRERDLDGAALHDLVRRCLEAVRGTSCRLVVNDRVDVALAAGADGVHLRADSYSARRARRLLDEWMLVGRSVHSVAEAARAARSRAVDYVTFGTVWPSASKPEHRPAAGLAGLAAAVHEAAPVPVLAIGGVTAERAADVAASQAAGVAAIGLFVNDEQGPTAEETVQRLRKALTPQL